MRGVRGCLNGLHLPVNVAATASGGPLLQWLQGCLSKKTALAMIFKLAEAAGTNGAAFWPQPVVGMTGTRAAA